MNQPDADTLAHLAPVRRQLRDIKGVTESRAGVFACAGRPLVDFVMRDAKPVAELRPQSSSQAVQRFDLGNALESRKLVDEVKKRISRLDDD